MSTSGGYHEYIGDVQYMGVFKLNLKGFYQVAIDYIKLISP